MKLCDGLSKNRSAGGFVFSKLQNHIGVQVVARHAGVDESLDFMWKNFSRPIQLNDLVRISGLSRRGFCKAFKKSVGINPGLFLRSVRLEHAQRLLIEHDLKLKQIALMSGFRSENTFCVAFLREMKTSPKKFQRQCWLTVCRERRQAGSALPPSNRLFRSAVAGNIPDHFNRSKKQDLHAVRIS